MGVGIWAMHYVGMLAVRISMTVLYHWPTVLLALLAAALPSAVALHLGDPSTLPVIGLWAVVFAAASIASINNRA